MSAERVEEAGEQADVARVKRASELEKHATSVATLNAIATRRAAMSETPNRK